MNACFRMQVVCVEMFHFKAQTGVRNTSMEKCSHKDETFPHNLNAIVDPAVTWFHENKEAHGELAAASTARSAIRARCESLCEAPVLAG